MVLIKNQLTFTLIFKSPFPNCTLLMRRNISRVDSLVLSWLFFIRKLLRILFFMCLVLILLFQQALLLLILLFQKPPWGSSTDLDRQVFRNRSNIYGRAFLQKKVNGWKLLAISTRISIIDVQLCCKYKSTE